MATDPTPEPSDPAASDGEGTSSLGYDPDFLTVSVPLPGASESGDELTYPRFSVVLDAERRLAKVTGVNIDGESLVDVPRTGEWHLDPRVAEDEQVGPEVYADNDLDRGHLVRRRDPGWGSEAEAREATEATFCYTNAAPQAAAFNQSKELWLGLEDHVLTYAESNDHRVSVFTAPILTEGDPEYRGVLIPRRFYKVAAWTTGDAASPLTAAGFLLDQSDLIDAAAGVTVDPLQGFKTFQLPIADIADLAGIDFGELPEVDVYVAQTLGTGASWRELTGSAEIVLAGPASAWEDQESEAGEDWD